MMQVRILSKYVVKKWIVPMGGRFNPLLRISRLISFCVRSHLGSSEVVFRHPRSLTLNELVVDYSVVLN